MTQYRGYYIDHFYFNNKSEIDEFVKSQAIEKFKTLNKIFSYRGTMEASIACDKQAEILHNQFGLTWNEIEAIEIEAFAA